MISNYLVFYHFEGRALKPVSPPKHGDVLHRGFEAPEVDPIEDFIEREEEKEITVRRSNSFHFEDEARDYLRRGQNRPS